MAPNYTKLRANLNLTINRLKLLEKKKTEMAVKSRKEIAEYLSANKVDRARIRVEHIIREEYLVEAMELLELMADLLLARMGLIQSQQVIDDSIEEAVATMIWVAPRLAADVEELKTISEIFRHKYGKEYHECCKANSKLNVNEKLIKRITLAAPSKKLVEQYLIEIAKVHNVPFEPDEKILNEEVFDGNLITLDAGCTGVPSEFPSVPGAPQPVCPYPPSNQPLVPNQPPATSTGPTDGPLDPWQPIPGPAHQYMPPNLYDQANTNGVNYQPPQMPLGGQSGGTAPPPYLPSVPGTSNEEKPPMSSGFDVDDLESRFNKLKKG